MASVWGELKRRNVVKVAVAYAIVGWLLVQIADTFFPALQLPEWTVTLVAGLVILGFPLALILSWAYELTPEGMKRSHEVEATESITHVTGRKIDFAIIGALVLALGFVVYNYVLEDPDPEAVVQETTTTVEPAAGSPAPVVAEERREVLPNSVAVLPFENLSPDPDNAYFAAGMHEEILNRLAKLRNLTVISRTSVLRYAENRPPIPEIAAELNVQAIMEGSVRFDGDRVLVQAQLIDATTDSHLWSDRYERELADVFAIQADVATNIANALEAEFSQTERENIESPPTESPEAYALYLRALTARSWEDFDRYLDQATSLDTQFALAHATKAAKYAYVLGAPWDPEWQRTIRENADRALALDSTLGLAHAALAMLHLANWRGGEAGEAFQLAVQWSPNEPGVLVLYERFKRYQGEYAEAIELGRRAVELDPNNSVSHFQLGVSYRLARNYEAAATALRRALALNPASANTHAQLARAEISRGNHEVALTELRIAEQLFGDNPPSFRFAQFAYAYSRLDRREDILRFFNELEERATESSVSGAVWAQAYIALGDYQEALDWLERAVSDPTLRAPNDWITLSEIIEHAYDHPVLNEPRFQEALGTFWITE